MRREVIPRRLTVGRVLLALAIAWGISTAARVYAGLERADQREPPHGPTCTTTLYYERCPGAWCEDGERAWCVP